MGSNDGAEICELVGIYLLWLIAQKYRMEDTGLYRDDGLAVVRSTRGRQADQYRKTVTKVMKDNGLKALFKCNLKIVDYLDITFDLNTGSYKPFKKPNNNPRYIHVESNHPRNIIKQIPKSISKRISANSSNEAIFKEAAPYYNTRLKEAGYSEVIKYQTSTPRNEAESGNPRMAETRPGTGTTPDTGLGVVQEEGNETTPVGIILESDDAAGPRYNRESPRDTEPGNGYSSRTQGSRS